MTIPANAWGYVTPTTIFDAISNTMLISETVTAKHPASGDWKIKSGIAHGVHIHGREAAACMVTRGPGGEFARHVVRWPWDEGKGHRWGDARSPYSMFHAALPPNAPSCRDPDDCNVITASSYHNGGVNVSMADGSLRFVNDSIDCGDITKKLGEELRDGIPGHWEGHWWTGPSTVGIWGAMATPAGRDTTSL